MKRVFLRIFPAATVIKLVGTIAAVAVSICYGVIADIAPQLDNAAWWQWLGGICGLLYVCASAVLPARLGTALFGVTVMLGQLSGSLVVDTVGIPGVQSRDLTAMRAFGGLIVFISVSIITWDRSRKPAEQVQINNDKVMIQSDSTEPVNSV